MTEETTALATQQTGGVAITEGPANLLSAIVTMAKDPAVDVAKLSALLEMQERMEVRQAEREFAAAFGRLSAVLPRVKKSGTIDLGTDKQSGKARGSIPFARWEDMDTIIRPLMAKEGFALSFDSAPRTAEGGGLIVTGTLMHRDGHHRTASIPLALDTGPGRNNLQAMGSSLSYGKRYTAEMLLNIIREGEDDDGKLGGTKFITPEQVDELVALAKDAGRQEGPILDRIFKGEVRSFDELKTDHFIIVKNLLLGVIAERTKKAAP